MPSLLRVLVGLVLGLLLTDPAHAHTIIELYNPFYLVGAAAVVVLSFVVVSIFVKTPVRLTTGPTYTLLAAPALGWSAPLVGLAKLASALLLGLVVLAGLFGSPIENWNPTPTFVSAVAWFLLPALQLLVGNVWAVLNPCKAVFEGAAALLGRASASRRARLRYPERLGVWPAVAALGLVTLAAAEPSESASPRLMSTVILLYSLLTWAGMALFGAAVWLRKAEIFTVFYELLATMAPTEVRRPRGDAGGATLVLRPYAVGLLARPSAGPDTLVFVLLLLAGGMFRGFIETRTWARLWLWLGVGPSDQSALHRALGLLGFFVLAAAVYAVACVLIRWTAGPGRPAVAIGLAFAFSLVPVAAVFHFAHGLDHALEDLQLLLRLASDPFGRGADLLGTRTRPIVEPDIFLVWHAQVALVVLAHVVGVAVAHLRALGLYDDHRVAVRSQVPMLALMVLYTVSGLWILSTVPLLVSDELAPPAAR